MKIFRILTLNLLVATALSLGLSACSDKDDEPAIEGTGITSTPWTAVVDAALEGQILSYDFTTTGAWKATSDQAWCQVLTTQGGAGLSTLRLKVAANDTKTGRSAKVTIQVTGASQACIFEVRQGDGVIEHGDGKYRDVNAWSLNYLKDMYLWNEPIQDMILDHSVDYSAFFTSVLDGVAEAGNLNREDGHWTNGQRDYYYSFIDSDAPTRATGESLNDSGIMNLTASVLGNGANAPIGFVILGVTPDTEADKAGLKRGDFIDKVNNVAITELNYKTLANTVFTGNCKLQVNTVVWGDGGTVTLTNTRSVDVGRSAYTDPAIYSSKILQTESGKRIGYLLYMGFDNAYDQQLIDIFDEFKQYGVNDLILDLRYNPGGHVLSSVLLGTLIAGNAHKDDIYVRTTYNARRTAAGEVGVYRIGNAENPERPAGYDKIATALNSSLGLNTIYVITSGATASASELVINGLRGLGIDVKIIGQRTNGKNVGMEGARMSSHSYSFTIYPITFYCENAVGNRNYSDGFKPDLEFDDSTFYPGDFGTYYDRLSNFAITWIETGAKPATSSVSRAGGMIKPLKMDADPTHNMVRRRGGNIALPQR